MMSIKMVDLVGQLSHIREEIDDEIREVLDTGRFIKGEKVIKFENALANYLDCNYVISCGNGTDALQIALMALDLSPGDEIIIPAFTYISVIEVVCLLRLTPVMVDVDYNTFNINAESIKNAITNRTRAIMPVHLFGQMADMESIMEIAGRHNLFIIEDNAQSLGSKSTAFDKYAGIIGHVGCTSFFPTKILGCFGDGGALMTNDQVLAQRIRMIGSHGQSKKYHHEIVGINSRLDTIQAAVLNVKLKYIDEFILKRRKVAEVYDEELAQIESIMVPTRDVRSHHVFHQYTIRVKNGLRDSLCGFLKTKGIPTMIYYPVPLHSQEGYKSYHNGIDLVNAERLSEEVLSLPMHTELESSDVEYIVESIKEFFS